MRVFWVFLLFSFVALNNIVKAQCGSIDFSINNTTGCIPLSIHYNQNKPTLQFKMVIYERWGEKIFETEEITEGWEGKIKDKPGDVGVYYYRIYAVPYDGYEKIKLNGQFLLLR